MEEPAGVAAGVFWKQAGQGWNFYGIYNALVSTQYLAVPESEHQIQT